MDERKALDTGTELKLPGMRCTIEKEIGRGSNSIVYKGRYPDHLNKEEWHTVLIKELFPFHKSGAIYRTGSGEIVTNESGLSTWDNHLASFENGNKAHLRLLRSFPAEMGANINTYPLNNTYYSVLGFTGGRSLREDIQSGIGAIRHIAVRLINLLDALHCFHEEGYLHLDIAPDNILLVGTGSRERVMLIDYNSVHYYHDGIADQGTLSIKAGYTAPEVRTGKLSSISQSSDIYSVAAVFYYMLSGRTLTSFQMSRPLPPDVSDMTVIADQPDTVRNMVQNVLTRGLATLQRRRYKNTAEMRRDIEELLDRIDGVGITHCSLWEVGRQSVLRTIRNNDSFSYLLDDMEIFNLNVLRASGEIETAKTCLLSMKKPDGNNLMLIGEGGAGKTTELLRFVLSAQENYFPNESAIIYISLFGRKNSSIRLIDLILENLRFKKDTGSIEEARQMLRQLLDTPLRTAKGEIPTLILLIDGVNEFSGPTDELVAQIKELSMLRGLRLLISGRNADDSFGVEQAALQRLTESDIRFELGKRGLAVPESHEMTELLKNPLMLSIFISSSLAKGGQLLINTREELMEVYFSSLFEKETAILPEESDERWILDVSMRSVLPAIAEVSRQKKHPLDEMELLDITGRLYGLMGSRAMLRIFPEWIGRTKAVLAGANNAEEWYGIVVIGILWKRMALLVRTDDGKYRIIHDIIGNYLAEIDRRNVGKLRARKRIYRITAIVILVIMVPFCICEFVTESTLNTYDETLAEIALTNGEEAYKYSLLQAEELIKLLDRLEGTQEYDGALELYETNVKKIDEYVKKLNYGGRVNDNIDRLLRSGKVFQYSRESLDEDYYVELINLEVSRRDEYHSWVDALGLLAKDDFVNQNYGEDFIASLSEISDLDAEMSGVLYYLAVYPHSVELSRIDNSFSKIHSDIKVQREHEPDSSDRRDLQKKIDSLKSRRVELKLDLDRMAMGIEDLHNRVN